ncbi:MAG: methyltransferase domain-containing protein [Ruminococcus sp.]
MNILKCPVCAGNMNQQEKILRCENNHCFDIAKEGYVNLLSARKSGDTTGDNKAMASSRRDFLNKGYYEPLAQAVCDCLAHYSDDGGSVLDICCGEGYYTAYCAERLERDFYGFDLSKNMVRLAAKRKCGARFFVANIASIPVRDGAVQAAFHLFAPFHAPEFRRILSDGGVIMTAIPGKHHLFGLKQALYDAPYYNDEKEPDADGLEVVERVRVRSEITLGSQPDINALFQMTPYYYHTPTEGMNRLQTFETLTTPIEFVLVIYKKK